MKQQGNGGSKSGAAKPVRVEAALESERRQREQLERRLQETERRLESALSAVAAPSTAAADLLALKSQLAAEMEAEADRALLELNLMELELLANAESEASATPASPLPQRIVQYIQLPPSAEQAPVAAVRAAPPAPKNYDDKLAAAQMAIDAAEARASHNAIQVRKLTEELAAARSEQIRLSSEMRGLKERIGGPAKAPSIAKAEKASASAATEWNELQSGGSIEPLVSAPLSQELTARREPDALEDLASALSDWGAPEQVAPSGAAGADLEDALQAWGSDEPLAAASPLAREETTDLEDALSAWGEVSEESVPVVIEADLPPAADSVIGVLASWGEEQPQRETKVEDSDLVNLLEVETISRLDMAEVSAEERVAEALGGELVEGMPEPMGASLLDDIAGSELIEEDTRWTPTPAVDDADEITVLAWDTPGREERYEEPAHDSAGEADESPAAAPAMPVVGAPSAATLAALDEAEAERRTVVAARAGQALPSAAPARAAQAESEPESLLEPEATPGDFQPDLAALAQRRPKPSAEGSRRGDKDAGRSAMISALQQFIGE